MSILKGWFGEKTTQVAKWIRLDGQIYQRFHDVIVSSRNATTQIDHLLILPYGIFVIETKNYKGWIFDSDEQPRCGRVLKENIAKNGPRKGSRFLGCSNWPKCKFTKSITF